MLQLTTRRGSDVLASLLTFYFTLIKLVVAVAVNCFWLSVTHTKKIEAQHLAHVIVPHGACSVFTEMDLTHNTLLINGR